MTLQRQCTLAFIGGFLGSLAVSAAIAITTIRKENAS